MNIKHISVKIKLKRRFIKTSEGGCFMSKNKSKEYEEKHDFKKQLNQKNIKIVYMINLYLPSQHFLNPHLQNEVL
jgi:hypothetical protein